MTALELAEKIIKHQAVCAEFTKCATCSKAAPLLAKMLLKAIGMIHDEYNYTDEEIAARIAELDTIAKGDG